MTYRFDSPLVWLFIGVNVAFDSYSNGNNEPILMLYSNNIKIKSLYYSKYILTNGV